MSNLQRTMYKGSASTSLNTVDHKSQKTTIVDSKDDDFQTMLVSRLSNLSFQNSTGASDVSQANELRSLSARSPLSRQESRQNSMISMILDPDELKTDNDNILSDSGSREHSSSNSSLNLKPKAPVKFYGIPDLINVLGLSSRASTRSRIGKPEREVLFAHLYRMIISPNSDVYIGAVGCNDDDFLNLVQLKNSIELENEFVGFEWEIWIRCVVAYGCVGVDEVASDVVANVFPLLMKTIGKLDIEEYKNRDDLDSIFLKTVDLSIWSFMCLVLFIFYEAENYGMLEHAKLFLNYLQNDALEDENIISACLYTVGLSIGLAWESGRDIRELVEDQVLETVKLILINKKRKESKLAAAVVTGLCFELLQKDDSEGGAEEDSDGEGVGFDDDDEFLNSEFELLKSEVLVLANEGSKKTGKKGKSAKNIFREVYDTLDRSTSKNIELDAIPMSKSKSITVTTWFAYIRVQILRFIFGNELSNWMTRSRDIRNMLKKTIKSGPMSGRSYGAADDDEEDTSFGTEFSTFKKEGDFKSKKDLEKERTKRLNRERRSKEEQMD